MSLGSGVNWKIYLGMTGRQAHGSVNLASQLRPAWTVNPITHLFVHHNVNPDSLFGFPLQ
jgi:hypothetical protein